MSAAKRVKLEVIGKEFPVQEVEIIVDLGNGISGRLLTQGSEAATIPERRWQQFKDELYRSEFWRQYKERLDNPDLEKSEEDCKEAYSEVVVEREIQRAWYESGKGTRPIGVPQAERWKELKGFSKLGVEHPMPDIPLSDQGDISVEGTGAENEGPEPVQGKEENAMTLNASGLQRYLVTVEYLGTRFQGWQKQKNRPDLRTVQGALEEAFKKFVGQPVACGGSSRTDTGVHALANVCHVDVERISKRKPGELLPPHEPEVVKRAVNHFLQSDGGDMTVMDVRAVRNDFHARYQARERTYHYRILAGNAHPSIFEKDRAWHVPKDLNLAAMKQASQVLVGLHDFSSFRAAGCQAKSPVKTLDELHVCEMPAFPSFPTSLDRRLYFTNTETNQPEVRVDCCPKANDDSCEPDISKSNLATSEAIGTHGRTSASQDSIAGRSPSTPRCYVITARARSFLYHQVRLLVGTLKAVGSGILTIEDVKTILAAKTIRATPTMAPAYGLYLAEVKYNFDEFKMNKTRECIGNENEGDE